MVSTADIASTSVTPHQIEAPSALAVIRCPTCPDLSSEIKCWLRLERELRADLAVCTRDGDAEILTQDLAAAGRRVDALIAIGQIAARHA